MPPKGTRQITILPGLTMKDSWMQHMYHLQLYIYYQKDCAVCNIRCPIDIKIKMEKEEKELEEKL